MTSVAKGNQTSKGKSVGKEDNTDCQSMKGRMVTDAPPTSQG
jgi:hypothetical protein